MNDRTISKRERYFLIAASAVIFLLPFILVGIKENIFMDEALSLTCTNLSPEEFQSIDGWSGTPDAFFTMIFGTSQPFQYRQVYLNATEDVHPPFYFFLLHTVSSFFPGRYSLLFPVVINAVFGVGILWMFHGILHLLIKGEEARMVCCLFLLVSAALWNDLSFLRMYVMSGFFVTALTYLLLSLDQKPKYYKIRLFLIIFLGIMTHYHFLIYLFGIGVVYLIVLMRRREYDLIRESILVAVSGILLSVVSFPAIFRQILSSKRGVEAQVNILELGTYPGRILFFLRSFGEDFFGVGWFAAVVIVITGMILIYLFRRGKERFHEKVLLVLFPQIFFFILVSLTVRFSSLRYMYPIYPMFLILCCVVVYYTTVRIRGMERHSVKILAGFVLAASLFSFFSNRFPHLYRGDAQKREVLSGYRDLDCIYLYAEEGEYAALYADCEEVKLYKTLTVMKLYSDTSVNEDLAEKERLMIVIDDGWFYQSNDPAEVIRDFCEEHDLPANVTEIGKFSNDTRTYLCSKGE